MKEKQRKKGRPHVHRVVFALISVQVSLLPATEGVSAVLQLGTQQEDIAHSSTSTDGNSSTESQGCAEKE